MTGYLVNFTVYTLAIVGIIFLAFMIAKQSLTNGYFSGKKNKFLTVESCLNLEPRKNLYVIKAGNERFLVSTDSEGSRFLTKLEDDNIPQEPDTEEYYNVPNLSGLNLSSLNQINTTNKSGVMRKLAQKLNSNTIQQSW